MKRTSFVTNEGIATPQLVANYEQVVVNLAPVKKAVKKKQLHGRDHIVVPMVMLTEGVHRGSKGPLFYPGAELEKSCIAWNHKPIVVNHPQINGKDCSACDPVFLDSRMAGLVLNTRYDKKLRAEAWLEEARMDQVDKRIREFVNNGQVMEISTGLWVENDGVEGEWEGEAYLGTAYNHKPDHLALLPDGVGACSTAKGAGLFQLNEMSYETMRDKLRPLLQSRFEQDYVYIERIFPSFVIFSLRGNKLFLLGYTATDSGVMLAEGDPEQVEVAFRRLGGEFVGNVDAESYFSYLENKLMAKKELVDAVIKSPHNQLTEADRNWVMNMSDDQVKKMMAPEGQGETPDNPHAKQVKEPLIPDGAKPGQIKDNEMVKDLTPEQIEYARQQGQPIAPSGGGHLPPSTDQPSPGQQPQLGQPQQKPQQGGKGGEQTNNAQAPVTNAAPAAPQMTPEQWMALAPPQFVDIYNQGVQALQAQRAQLLQTIAANPGFANVFNQEELAKKTMPELQQLAAAARASMPVENQQQQQALALAAWPQGLPGPYAGAGVMPVQVTNSNRKGPEPLGLPKPEFKKGQTH